MKYDSYNDYIYFIMGASIASGRGFWVGSEGDSNKNLKNTETIVSMSNNNRVARMSVRRMPNEQSL